jgi:PAS domain-containing protein
MRDTSGKDSIPGPPPPQSTNLRERMRVVEKRDWWLWSCAVLITLLLTLAVISFVLPTLHARWPTFNSAPMGDTVLGLVGMVLLFDIYTVYQHFQVQQVRKQLIAREELFRLITENAADMIAVVSVDGERLYNSPSYEKILGYIPKGRRASNRFIRTIGKRSKRPPPRRVGPGLVRAWSTACVTRTGTGSSWSPWLAPSLTSRALSKS